MKLTTKQVEKFQQLYQARFGEVVSYKQAYDKGARLVRLIEFIYKQNNPLSSEDNALVSKSYAVHRTKI